MIFGSKRDSNLFLHIRRELLHGVIEQEVLYYKVDLETTELNLYGESERKNYFVPLRLTCLIKRGDQNWGDLDSVVDMNREVSFAFIWEDLQKGQCLPEVGDIIEWNKDYYEVEGVKENQLWLGKDRRYRIEDQEPQDRTDKFGSTISVVCSTHLSRISKLNIVRENR